MLRDLSYRHSWFKQTGGLSLRVRGVRVEAGRGEGLLRAAFIRVGIRVTSRVGQQARGQGKVFEADHCLHSDAVSSVEIHQPVEGAERLVPDAVLTASLQHAEMFHPVTITAKQERSAHQCEDESCVVLSGTCTLLHFTFYFYFTTS